MWSDWLIFYDCDFQSVCPLMEKDRGLWKLSNGRDWLRGKLGLVLMGKAMLSKSLIQFSVDGWSCLPSLLFTWGQTMVEVMKIMVISIKRSHACIATLSAPNLATGHCQPMSLLETPGHSWASLGQSLLGSLLLSENCQHFSKLLKSYFSPLNTDYQPTPVLVPEKSHGWRSLVG